jgi:hypothetical protein
MGTPSGPNWPSGVPIRTEMGRDEEPIVVLNQRKYVVEHGSSPVLPWSI